MEVKDDDNYVCLIPHKQCEVRLPLETLMTEDDYKERRDLFLQGFAKVQRKAHDRPKSFYAVAGIHGLPNVPYNEDGSKKGGYCKHNTILFPTWHRLYVLLLEQLIIEEARNIVELDYKGNNKYESEVEKIRFPYWDWAGSSVLCQGIPSVLFEEFVYVNDNNKKIRNPLRAYTLPVDLGNLELVGDTSNPTQRPYNPDKNHYPYTPAGFATVRHPDENYLSNKESTSLKVVTCCSSTFRPGIYEIFDHVDKWKQFSHTGSSDCPPTPPKDDKDKDDDYYKSYTSIEGVHDAVHEAIAGDSGHMAYAETAAFDPIFFLFHSNMDRFTAIWQAVYTESWIVEEDTPCGKINENTELKPFLKSSKPSKSYWTSEEARYVVKQLGYTYPELELDLPPEKLKSYIKNQYQPVNCSKQGYKLAITVMKHKVGSPFQIMAFVDLPTGLTSTSTTSANFAGFISIFARNSETISDCENCEANPNVLVNGSIDITVCLQRLKLIDMKDGTYFKSDDKPPLHERITLVPVLKDGSTIKNEMAGLKYPAYCWKINYNDFMSLPKYENIGVVKPKSHDLFKIAL